MQGPTALWEKGKHTRFCRTWLSKMTSGLKKVRTGRTVFPVEYHREVAMEAISKGSWLCLWSRCSTFSQHSLRLQRRIQRGEKPHNLERKSWLLVFSSHWLACKEFEMCLCWPAQDMLNPGATGLGVWPPESGKAMRANAWFFRGKSKGDM